MYYSEQPITIPQAVDIVPSVSQTEAFHDRSDQYSVLPTVDVLKALKTEGFNIYGVTEANPRKEERKGFQKHLVRLRRQEHALKDYAPEVIIINSFDGSTAYQIMGGLYRFACANGLIVGRKFAEFRIKHINAQLDNVIDATYEVVEQFDRISGRIEDMQRTRLSRADKIDFAQQAMRLRFPDHVREKKDLPVSHTQVLEARRSADRSDDTFSVYNVVQENLIRGGLQTKKRSTKPIKSVTTLREINQGLWDIAEGFIG